MSLMHQKGDQALGEAHAFGLVLAGSGTDHAEDRTLVTAIKTTDHWLTGHNGLDRITLSDCRSARRTRN